jgi:soluble lytic murein transglycosylase-like protein
VHYSRQDRIRKDLALGQTLLGALLAMAVSCTPAHSETAAATQTLLSSLLVTQDITRESIDEARSPRRHALERPLPDDPLGAAGQLHRNGRNEEASRMLRRWLDWAPQGPDAGLSRTLLAKVLIELGRHGEALEALNTTAPHTVMDLAAFLKGEALRVTGNPDAAAQAYRTVTSFHRSPLAPAAAFREADALFEAGHFRKAAKRYVAVLTQYPEYPKRLMVRFRLAKCREAKRKLRLAIRTYQDLVKRAPETSAGKAAQEALTQLEKAGHKIPSPSFEQRLQWAIELRKKRQWRPAADLLQALAREAPSRGSRAVVETHLGKALESLDQYQAALDAYKRARRFGANMSDITARRIKTLRKMGRTKDAVELAQRVAGSSRKVKDMAAAKIYIEDGLYEKGRRLFRRYHRKSRMSATRWQLAWLDYRTGRYKRASRGFASLLKNKNFRAHKVAYWLARTHMKQGRTKQAKAEFTAIVHAGPTDYYGIQAANRILDMGDNTLFRKLTQSALEDLPSPAERKQHGGSIRWRGADGTTTPVGAPRPRITQALHDAAKRYGQAFPELWRAHDRYRMGLDDEARLELRTAKAERARARKGSAKRLAGRRASLFMDMRRHKRGLWGSRSGMPLKLSYLERRREVKRIKAIKKLGSGINGTLRDLLAGVGDHYWGRRRALSNHWRRLKGIPTRDSQAIFKAAYPLAFEAVLRQRSANYALSPFLVASLARVESGFNELAVSTAGARGLLQVMPVTGNLIAGRRGKVEFAAADLLDPEVSIDYGTWYMDQLQYKFGGQEPLAVISYNAGPHRVQAWLARRGDKSELDEFIEEVPYRQARRYVKRVIQYVGMYRRIYEERSDLYIGQRLDTNFRHNINW